MAVAILVRKYCFSHYCITLFGYILVNYSNLCTLNILHLRLILSFVSHCSNTHNHNKQTSFHNPSTLHINMSTIKSQSFESPMKSKAFWYWKYQEVMYVYISEMTNKLYERYYCFCCTGLNALSTWNNRKCCNMFVLELHTFTLWNITYRWILVKHENIQEITYLKYVTHKYDKVQHLWRTHMPLHYDWSIACTFVLDFILIMGHIFYDFVWLNI